MLAEKIHECIERLPAAFQAEVLNFVEYLLAKAERNTVREEAKAWSDLSLASAMRGMEEEDGPEYTVKDLRVTF